MEALPACIWDVDSGLIVLYRDGPASAVSGAYALVIDPADGQSAHYVGELPPDCGLWVIRAPSSPRFQLLFYPEKRTPPCSGAPAAAIPFNAALRVDPRVPAADFYHLSGWLFRPAESDDGLRIPMMERLEVPAGQRLHDALAELGWTLGEQSGVAVTCARGAEPNAERGPSVNPFRQLSDGVEVRFTVVRDPRPLPEDVVSLEGFTENDLEIPAVIVDLTPFGDLDLLMREAFCFFHAPQDSQAEVACCFGAEAPIVYAEDGRRLLLWACSEACHLDILGVHFSGGQGLIARVDEYTEIPLHGVDTQEDSSLIAVQYYGNDFRVRPRQMLESLEGFRVDTERLAMRLHADWIIDHHAWREADWRGAEKAGAFSLVAFYDLLNKLHHALAEAAPASPLRALAEPLRSLRHFFARPELGPSLLSVGTGLENVLARPGLRLDALFDPNLISPASALAAATEPEVRDLGTWVEGQNPETQSMLWRFMLAGGLASHWRDLAITPEQVAGRDPGQLARRLRLTMAPPELSVPLAILADLDEEIAPLREPLRTLADADKRFDALRRASLALKDELDSIIQDLAFTRRRPTLSRDAARARFEAASPELDSLTPGDIRKRLLAHAAQDPDLHQFAGVIEQIRLRVTMIALADILGVDLDFLSASTTDAPERFPIDFGFEELSNELDPAVDTLSLGASFASGQQNSPVVDGQNGQSGLTADRIAQDLPALSSSALGRGPASKPSTIEPRARNPEGTETVPERGSPLGESELELLDWCGHVLCHDLHAVLGLHDEGRSASEDLSAVGLEVDQFMDNWGLLDGDTPEPLPEWTGARLHAQAEMRWRWDQGMAALRSRLAVDGTHGGGPVAILERIVPLREQVIAEILWGRVLEDAARLRQAESNAELADLVARIHDTCGPVEWGPLSAALEAARG